MADRLRFTLNGFDDLKRTLENIGPELATKAGQTTIRKGAKTVADAIKTGAPRSEEADRSPASEAYGHLEDNIKVRKGKSKVPHTVTSTVTMGNAFWWRFLEYGTVKAKPKPFIKDAFDSVREKVANDIREDLSKALDRLIKKYGKTR